MCFRRGGAWKGDRLEEEEYVFDGKVATELSNGRRELLTALLFGCNTGAKFEGGEEGVCVVQYYYCEPPPRLDWRKQ